MGTEDKIVDKTPNKTRIYILLILILILVAVLVIRFITAERPLPAGSLDLVICPKCNERFVARIEDITNKSDSANFCPKCGNHIAHIYKCDDCEYEFPLLVNHVPPANNLKTMDKFHFVMNQQKCPNCGSTRTQQLSPP